MYALVELKNVSGIFIHLNIGTSMTSVYALKQE